MSENPVLHSHLVRLSYGDTDPAGILYYAAWFPKMEALQSEFLFFQGLRQDRLKEDFGWWTVSRATSCEYLAAAGLFDQIRIELRRGSVGTSSFAFDFTMRRVSDDVLVARAVSTLVTVSPEQSTVRIPELLHDHLANWGSSEWAAAHAITGADALA
ncbi:acyl-CoA thioesterase [Glaciibacter psychrotolerans]|uniref:Acyl-CoA thioester hydrolase n=1 Tax=Glaciibacter psychrotolerans TaxID=670054 RepID=A0A7Z0J713_9MICO|nr:thioesterase family protein [Leifsonia psychrotolerans]NYJ20483.1 acyl-CoA thioester hydrolase [Leifsonia psychrotolerans]